MYKLKTIATASFLLVSGASAIPEENPKYTTDEGYGVNLFECDHELQALSTDNRQKKIQGEIFRMCMAPNPKSVEDGIFIERIDSFTWELEHKEGFVEQKAVIDGDGDNILSVLDCKADGSLCYVDSLLSYGFFVDTGSVLGYGKATLSGNNGTVDIERHLFPHDFKFTMKNADGSEMDADDLAELAERMGEQGVQYVESPQSQEL